MVTVKQIRELKPTPVQSGGNMIIHVCDQSMEIDGAVDVVTFSNNGVDDNSAALQSMINENEIITNHREEILGFLKENYPEEFI